MISTVTIRNPAVIETICEAEAEKVGRNPTETSENLIQKGWEAIKRERAAQRDAKPRRTRTH